ncbi:MAG: hypothetical protein DRI89_00775 [Bacteroidetes bacterium]|nr:MAG: hypothetical protein DRI89_00775 [Bacteroidota bacterium]
MRMAFPTNDKINIFKRTGRANAFLIVDVDPTAINEIDYRINKHSHEEHLQVEDQSHDHSHAELTETLSDCAFVVANVIGKQLLADITNAGIVVFKTKEENIKNAIADFNAQRHFGEGGE